MKPKFGVLDCCNKQMNVTYPGAPHLRPMHVPAAVPSFFFTHDHAHAHSRALFQLSSTHVHGRMHRTQRLPWLRMPATCCLSVHQRS